MICLLIEGVADFSQRGSTAHKARVKFVVYKHDKLAYTNFCFSKLVWSFSSPGAFSRHTFVGFVDPWELLGI